MELEASRLTASREGSVHRMEGYVIDGVHEGLVLGVRCLVFSMALE